MSKETQKILDRRNAYRRCFLSEDGQLTADGKIVMADLSRFCRWFGHQTVVSPVSNETDIPASFQAIGRREVYARLIANLHIDDADIFRFTHSEALDE